jgi:hypothetical protein
MDHLGGGMIASPEEVKGIYSGYIKAALVGQEAVDGYVNILRGR